MCQSATCRGKTEIRVYAIAGYTRKVRGIGGLICDIHPYFFGSEGSGAPVWVLVRVPALTRMAPIRDMPFARL
jgi:hypothetical protein